MRRPPDAGTYTALAVMVAVWGGAFLLMKIGARHADPVFVAGARTWIGAAFVTAAATLLARRLPTERRILAWCALAGLLSVVIPFIAFAWAAARLPSGVVGLFIAVIPLVILPLSHVLSDALDLNERMTVEKAAGVLIGAAGVALIFGPGVFANLGSSDAIAQLVCLLGAISLAAGAISIRAMPKTDPIGAAAAQLLFGSVIVAPFALSTAPDLTAMPLEGWAALTALGALASGLAIILRVYVISTAGPVFMSTTGYLVPLAAVLIGWLIAGERFTSGDLAGGALVLLGVAVSRGAARAVLARRGA